MLAHFVALIMWFTGYLTIFEKSLVCGPVGDKKGGPAFFGFEDHVDGSEFWQDLGPTTTSMLQEWFSHCPQFRNHPPIFFFSEMSVNLYKTNKNGAAFVKGCGTVRVQSPSVSHGQHKLPPVVVPRLLGCVAVY